MPVCGILEHMKKEIFIELITSRQLWEFYAIIIFKMKNQME